MILMCSVMTLAQTAQDGDSVSQPIPPQEKVEKQVPAVSDTAPAPSSVVKKETVVKQDVPKKTERPREKAADTAPVTAKSDLGGAGGLLEIKDGDYLYRRIPDKKFPENAQAGLAGFEVGASIESSDGEILEPVQRRGLFGLSADATNYMAKGVLVFIILIIVVLYRMRSRTRRSTVHKSFR